MKRWRGPNYPGEYPTLGWAVIDWIEQNCVIPDGDHVGEPFILTREMCLHILHHYRVTVDGPPPKQLAGTDVEGGRWWHERGSQLVRPQKWGKGPLSAALCCVEAGGPVVFDGWDADGEPVGRRWSTPLIQVTAMSEDQTDNIYLPLLSMIRRGPLVDVFPDAGATRINLPDGGRIESTTSAGISRLGNPVRFVAQDETHSCTKQNGGIRLMQTQRRNLAGMGGRFFETTNGWDVSQTSMAQLSNDHPVGMFVNYPAPPTGSVKNKRERRRVLRSVYGDSVTTKGGWVDLDRIDSEIESLIPTDPSQAERYFLNRCDAGSSKAFDLEQWNNLADSVNIDKNALIVVGVDGARFRDAIAVVATDVDTGHQWPVIVLERPPAADDNYEHDFDAVDAAMIELFDRFQVWRVYIDPQKIETLVNRWAGRWGQTRILEWFTKRPTAMCWAVHNYQAAIAAGDLTHPGDEVMTRHIGNAVRVHKNVFDDEGRPLHWIEKPKVAGPPLCIDTAVAAVISWEARGDAIAAGARPKRKGFAPPVRMR